MREGIVLTMSPDIPDTLIYKFLCEAGFTGDMWQDFAEGLAGWALPIIRAWIGNGAIYYHTALLGIRVSPSPEQLLLLRDPGLREELAQMTVATALSRLQRGWLNNQGWRPKQGTLMATWFINGCKYAFAGEFEKFCKDHRSAPAGTVSLDDPAVAEVVQAAVADDQAGEKRRDEEAVKEALSLLDLDPISHAIVLGKIAAESDKEIAVRVGLTPKAVGQRWSRLMDAHPLLDVLRRGRR
ncbi:hypothetical protein [Nocardia sp. NPDC004604]|uniref:hypothetical protein n=1 Tax=Nocardia sp. NPDC004604 TaxID=3157013 RepID=UPI00339EC9D0